MTVLKLYEMDQNRSPIKQMIDNTMVKILWNKLFTIKILKFILILINYNCVPMFSYIFCDVECNKFCHILKKLILSYFIFILNNRK